ncbi:MAG: HPr(Ser) kinase/phosphatase [Oscillospiraceae bacterium]|jgi:HPr kinase/phosphorylase|nr:HPr(Ser) kinase/phosphatase [Oscillospiraceae bacterium]
MSCDFSVSLKKIIKNFSLEVLFVPKKFEQTFIFSSDVSRPGFELTGFLNFFDKTKILVFGKTEHNFLTKFLYLQRYKIIDKLFALNPPAIIITKNIKPYKEIIKSARKHKISVLRTSKETSTFITALISFLNIELAPRIIRHGVLIEVYGKGLIIIGDSGIGKSETAAELMKRGHKLVADDTIEIRKVSKKSLVGSSPYVKHFMELRGIGVINIKNIFGVNSVKTNKKIDIIVQLESWDSWNLSKICDRIKTDDEYLNILSLRIPLFRIPVKPGRNLAIIIEVAVMSFRQKSVEKNFEKELFNSLIVNEE